MNEFETEDLGKPPGTIGRIDAANDVETFSTSETLGELAKALAAVQAEIKDPERGRTGQIGNQRFDYADLADVMACIRPVISKHGVAITQWPHGEGNVVSVTTLLIHTSGEWIKATRTMLVEKGRGSLIQTEGLLVSYIRRYAASGAFGIAQSDADADEPEACNLITPEQVSQIRGKAKELGRDEEAFCKWLKVKDLESIPVDWFDRTMGALAKAEEAMKRERQK